MASLQKAQTGNRVYGAGGRSPNLGQVSAQGAQGYLKRELGKRNSPTARPVGGDGKSDSRSGVASRALQGMMGGGGGRQQAGGLKPGRKSPLNTSNPLAPQPQAAAPPAANPNSPSGLPAPMIPQVTINANGILELPYNQNYAADVYQSVADSNNELTALQQEEQQAAIQAMQARREAETQYGQLKTQTESGNASSGALFSSMNGQNIVANANAFTGTLADITNNEAQSKADIATRRAAIQTALNQQLAESAQSYSDELGQEAGTLGFGTGYGQEGERNVGRPNRPSKPAPNKPNKPKDKEKDKPKGAHGGPVKGKKK